MFDQAASEFFKQGLGYVISILEVAIILWLFRKLDEKDKMIQNRDQVIMALQEKRVTDYKENSEKVINSVNNAAGGIQSLKEAALSQANAITASISQTNSIIRMLENIKGSEK